MKGKPDRRSLQNRCVWLEAGRGLAFQSPSVLSVALDLPWLHRPGVRWFCPSSVSYGKTTGHISTDELSRRPNDKET